MLKPKSFVIQLHYIIICIDIWKYEMVKKSQTILIIIYLGNSVHWFSIVSPLWHIMYDVILSKVLRITDCVAESIYKRFCFVWSIGNAL